LAKFPIPRLYLTATLPPRLMPSFLISTSLTENVKEIRGYTCRPEIKYSVHRVKRGEDAMKVCLGLTKSMESRLPKDSRMILYTVSKHQAMVIQRELFCYIYHADLSDELRQRNIEGWRLGESQILVGTSAITNGIDEPYVDVVIFLEMPFGLIDFVQGSGRGGRKGRKSETILITSEDNIGYGDDPQGFKCMEEMKAWTKNVDKCRRGEISRCMDGKVIVCESLPGAQLCDVCEEKGAHIRRANEVTEEERLLGLDWAFDDEDICSIDFFRPPASSTPTKSTKVPVLPKLYEIPDIGMDVRVQTIMYDNGFQAKMDIIEQISKFLSVMRGNCLVCWVWTGKLEAISGGHRSIADCQGSKQIRGGAHTEWGFLWTWKRNNLKYKRFKYCYRCGYPQEPHIPKGHPEIGKGCPFEDSIAKIAWIVRHVDDLWEAIHVHFQLDQQTDINTYGRWLAEETDVVASFNNSIKVLQWLWIRHGMRLEL
jgi:hypothetical protein